DMNKEIKEVKNRVVAHDSPLVETSVPPAHLKESNIKENNGSSGVLPCQLPPKELNLGSFTLPCIIGSLYMSALVDLGRTFLAAIHARIDVFNKKISLGIVNDRILFDVNGILSRPPTSLAYVCMAKTILEEELFDLLGIAKDLFPYDSPLCVEFEKFNHILETNESDKPYFMDYEKFYLEFRDEIDQLADEYELRIGKKGDILQDIWGNCREISNDSPESWYKDRFEEKGKRECSMYRIPYYP
nr:RNA-directed DNA polymerase, eukaryota, reverse transcriptase zinc-binding domain protein [Tanacetum cinerariifolium]